MLCVASNAARSLVAKAECDARLIELGHTPIGPWRGTQKPYPVICKNGHDGSPRPNNIHSGRGACNICAGRDSAVAEAACRARLIKMGHQPIGPWAGANEPYPIICKNGHYCSPHSNSIQPGNGVCRICAGQDSATAEAACRARLIEMGHLPIGPWRGAKKSYPIICKNGHSCFPQPQSVQQGSGACRICAGMEWNLFYVITNETQHRAKFGITSTDFRPRLRSHRRTGYTDVSRKLELPNAKLLEDEVRRTLKLAGIEPVRGREYFDLSALPAILDVVDNWQADATPAMELIGSRSGGNQQMALFAA